MKKGYGGRETGDGPTMVTECLGVDVSFLTYKEKKTSVSQPLVSIPYISPTYREKERNIQPQNSRFYAPPPSSPTQSNSFS